VPTVLRRGPFRFFFYSNEGLEGPHVHVERDRKVAKLWLNPQRIASAGDFSAVEMREIERIVEQEHDLLWKAWNDFFER
jgi:hypothetical protein